MFADALRFTGSGQGLVSGRFELDGAHSAAVAGPAIIVLRTRDLRALRAAGEAKGPFSTLRTQHEGKGLGHYFRGVEPIALEGKYTEPGRLRSALEKYFAGTSSKAVHFLGVSEDLFAEVARETPGEKRSPADAFLGSSPAAGKIRERIQRAATEPEHEDMPVLILGPSGVGKEIVARAIHDLGRGTRGGPWVPLNCAAIMKELLEPELFGIEAKFATDVAGREGLWEQAENGTLFLNEIGDLTLEHQAKLLRALEEGETRRVGGRTQIPVNARIIADTNRDLDEMRRKGTFREDLYQRLASIIIRIPSLVERGADLDELAQRLWQERRGQSPKTVLAPELIEALRAYGLPGNVRELKALFQMLAFEFPGELSPGVQQLLDTWRARGDGPFRSSEHSSVRPAPAPAAESGSLGTLRAQVARFESQRTRYERLTELLRAILEKVAEQVAPLAIVHARTKPLASFAERVQRDGVRFEELRDLSGARIVVPTEDEIRAVCALLERYLEVDAAMSTAEVTAGAARPGYAARRLVVRLDRLRAQELAAALGCEVPSEVLGLWAEVEVRTVLEHAWAHVSREMGHAERLPLPERWSAELAETARLLRAVDASFARIHAGFGAYRTSQRAYLDPEQKQREAALLANVLACAPDPSVAVRLAKLAMTDGDWDRAIAVLEPFAADGYQPALRDLGVAICQKHRDRPESPEHLHGQRLLERACAEPHRDPDALASLGGTWKRRGRHDQAREYYGRAHALDPADPYALWGLLEAELALHPEVDSIAAREPAIRRAVERCREHIEVGINLPWALYDLGKFLLLLGERTQGLIVSARAVELSTAGFMIQTSLESLDRLAGRREKWSGVDEARAILALGCAVKFPSEAARRQLEKLLPARAKVTAPVVFVVESADASAGKRSAAGRAIDEALRDYRGTVLAGNGLQGWADVVGSGVTPSEVRVLAVGIGDEAEVERRVGAALGARVISMGEGGQAATLDANAIRAAIESAS